MDQVVQQNAQLVQQAARSANELESEAARLREAVERFSIAEPTNHRSPSSLSAALLPRLTGHKPPAEHTEEWAPF
jgi:methyl-accepting chemotaxis protein-2 (aspartate sensor receptor)